MISNQYKYPAVAAVALSLGTLAISMATPANAMPATVDYQCRPALPKGDRISIDYNSGGKSITVQFPNGQSIRMPIQRSGSGFRYAGKNVVVWGKGQTTVTLDVAGEASRECVTVR